MNQSLRTLLTIFLFHLIVVPCICAEDGMPSIIDATGSNGRVEVSVDRPDTIGSSLIVIDKATSLLAYFEDGREVLRFPVAFGSRPGQKKKRGDRRTPEGDYRVVAKHRASKYHKFLWINYPNRDDAIRGLEARLISGRDYEAIITALENDAIPPQQTRLGGYIGIHGGKAVRIYRKTLFLDDDYNWTLGCIAAKNEHIDRLYDIVEVGTRVRIK
ncbi:MAG: L,D-transpeptidase [Candidatus Latescibacteria bacterium]|nr:L,D-transpeptidase [Candidatus Latescibacterota bacterium]